MQEETVGMNRTITYIHEYRGSAQLVTGRGTESRPEKWLGPSKKPTLKPEEETRTPLCACVFA